MAAFVSVCGSNASVRRGGSSTRAAKQEKQTRQRCGRKAAVMNSAAASSDGGIMDDLAVVFDEIVPASTDFAAKFQSNRGAEVRTVGETVKAFFAEYARPLPTVYSTVINETLTTTHLSVVHYAFHYDALFAFGFVEAFDRFLQYYPSDEERARLYDAMTSALTLDGAQMRRDAAAVKEWANGRTLEDVLALAAGEGEDSGGVIGAAFKTARDLPRIEFHVSRMFSLGCVFLVEAVGVKTEGERETLEKIAGKLDLSSFFLTDALDQYRAGMERLKAAEQLFAEVAARDMRKNAERLAEKAKLAEELAEKAEKEASEGSTAPEPTTVGASAGDSAKSE